MVCLFLLSLAMHQNRAIIEHNIFCSSRNGVVSIQNPPALVLTASWGQRTRLNRKVDLLLSQEVSNAVSVSSGGAPSLGKEVDFS